MTKHKGRLSIPATSSSFLPKMTLRRISISNYRSIHWANVDCAPSLDGSTTLGLIGLNEAGKSSVLKAIASLNGAVEVTAKDFRDKASSSSVYLEYELEEEEAEKIWMQVSATKPDVQPEHFEPRRFKFCASVDFAGLAKSYWIALIYRKIKAEKPVEWVRVDALPAKVTQTPIFWTAEDNYLIAKPIDLAQFAANPVSVSIPLRNCFLLAGIEDIPERIALMQGDSTEIELLCRELGETVTKHIQQVWPKHPVEISFLITNNQLHFHVRDKGTPGKAKTADQRSDGFRQFVSFLLTVSAENRNEELSNSILLLDEPETHLHPMAQEYLLNELVQITKNDRNNVVIFATHSNYMIDKADLSRNFRVIKQGDETKLERLDQKSATYASVSYEVFGIASSDYHNELYGVLHERFQDEDLKDERREFVKVFDDAFLHKRLGQKKNKPWKGRSNEVTLPTYIRNAIHHPEAGVRIAESELRTSIDLMRKHL